MDERNEQPKILKSDEPEKLEVFKAASLSNQIRFYITRDWYLTAIESDEGHSIMLGEDIGNTGNAPNIRTVIKENLKELIKILSLSFLIFAICCVGLVYVVIKIDNAIVFLFISNIVAFILSIVSIVELESMKTIDHRIKSKHSAEHMMVNFLEINKRLPKNIEEVKKCSRFSSNCGSRALINNGIAEEFISSIIATILSAIISGIVDYLFHDATVTITVLIVTYFVIKFVGVILITKYNKLNYIVTPTKNALTKIVQYGNTTKNVKDSDIILAYAVAKEWMQIVYPEFYNEEEDVFWENIES